jgi:hypothetical protein
MCLIAIRSLLKNSACILLYRLPGPFGCYRDKNERSGSRGMAGVDLGAADKFSRYGFAVLNVFDPSPRQVGSTVLDSGPVLS